MPIICCHAAIIRLFFAAYVAAMLSRRCHAAGAALCQRYERVADADSAAPLDTLLRRYLCHDAALRAMLLAAICCCRADFRH